MSGSPFDTLKLRQYPAVRQGQAWNSADALLVEAARARDVPGDQILVVNDEFGALCVALNAKTLWTDSYLASLSLSNNVSDNEAAPVKVLWSTEDISPGPEQGSCLTVIIRVPKQRAYFECQLSQLSRRLPPSALVLAAGMDKHLSPGIADLLETYIGPTERHRGQRKARLFSAVRDDRAPALFSGASDYYCAELDTTLTSLPNVFSREKMDIGSRFLLDNLSKLGAADKLIDLACGNGLIGLTALSMGLGDTLLMCDESAMALASARINARKLPVESQVSFHHGDGLLSYSGQRADLILCNPPFHLNHRMDERVGRRLLVQSAAHLVKGGTLCLVANRHLNYLPVLKREFKQVEKMAQNGKFIIWRATR